MTNEKQLTSRDEERIKEALLQAVANGHHGRKAKDLAAGLVEAFLFIEEQGANRPTKPASSASA